MTVSSRFDAALAAAESGRDMVVSSFDVLMTRTAQRTNDVMRALTLFTVLGLPATITAGFLGMNVVVPVSKDDPASFWRAHLDDAVGRLVAHIRDFRPAVVITYDAYGGYGHPDHVQAHRVTLIAVEAAAAEPLYPDAGAPWRTAKVYFATLPKSVIVMASRLLAERGLPTPFDPAERVEDVVLGTSDHEITTTVDVRPWLERKLAALKSHATQLGPDSFFLNVPDDLAELTFGTEWFVRHRSGVPAPAREDDLFAGVAT